MQILLEVYEDRRGGFRWRLVARNGKIVADSGESYTRKADAKRACRRTVELICSATIEG